MEQSLLALSPFVVFLVVGGIKKLQSIQLSTHHKAILRFVAGVLSFGAAVAVSISSGQPIDENVVEVFVNGLLAFLGSQGAFFLSKKPSQ